MMILRVIGLMILLFLLGCTHSRPSGESLVLSFQELSCHNCEKDVLNILTTKSGILEASFRPAWAEIHLRYNPTHTTPQALLMLLKKSGYQVKEGAGKGSYLSGATFPSSTDVEWISLQGATIEIEKHLVPGKITLFNLYSDWCKACKKMDQELVKILEEVEEKTMVALRKINIIDLTSPVSRQFLGDKSKLPHFIVYSTEGNLVDKISGSDVKRLQRAISQAAEL